MKKVRLHVVDEATLGTGQNFKVGSVAQSDPKMGSGSSDPHEGALNLQHAYRIVRFFG